MSLRIPPDTRVSVDQLGQMLGVSQTPVREALSMLEAGGFIVKRQFSGYYTPPRMDRAQLDELFEYRLLVEPHLAKKAATLISADALARIEKLLTVEAPSHQDAARMDAEFHTIIAEQAGNRLIAEALSRLHIHIHIFRSCFLSSIAEEAVIEHRQILAAILERDGAAARRAMKRHIELSYDRLRGFIGE